ncbi:MAG: preprotein translocase subunit YajC [Rickettsiales bacterium]|nr:preprotein translocase subunit YajC [Rickettsiales bacterium]
MATAQKPAAETIASTEEQAVPHQLTAEKMMTDNLLMIGLLFFIFYFMLIRPQQKRIKNHQALVKSLQKGDKIITTGGIIGTISKLEGDDIVVLEIAPDVKIRLSRSAITEVVKDGASGSKVANDN